MATYTKVSRDLPSSERSVLITAVEAGDRIDLIDALGRPARGLKLVTTDAADEVSYRLNSLIRKEIVVNDSVNAPYPDTVEMWSEASTYPVYTDTGAAIELVNGLKVSSIEVTALTLSTGTTISIVAW